jgi:choline dehydrogenase-like flavoprotein
VGKGVRYRADAAAGGRDMLDFDYLIIGGGSSGCVVASRLSEDPRVNICLLEAGGAGNSWVVNTPMATALMLPSKINNWAFETVRQTVWKNIS